MNSYEEENFTRKPLTKTEIAREKRLRRGANLNNLTSFDDARLLLDDNINMEEYLNARKDKKKKSQGGLPIKIILIMLIVILCLCFFIFKGKSKKKGGKKKKIRYT